MNLKLNVLFEDNHLLIVEKPRNVLVQEDISGDADLLNIGKDFLVKKYNKPGNAFLGLVHRLDRPVGGVILFAKTSKAASRISNEIRLNRFSRSYLAIVRGTPKKREGKLTDFLLKEREKNKSEVVHPSTKDSKKAILRYRVLDADPLENLSLVSIELETGRSHQIRLQLAHMGYPIYGDQKYGQKESKVGQQIALWAHSLSVKHPTKNEIVHVSINPPREYPWNIFDFGD